MVAVVGWRLFSVRIGYNTESFIVRRFEFSCVPVNTACIPMCIFCHALCTAVLLRQSFARSSHLAFAPAPRIFAGQIYHNVSDSSVHDHRSAQAVQLHNTVAMEETLAERRRLASTIFSTLFTTDNAWLLAAGSLGELFAWDANLALNYPDDSVVTPTLQPSMSFTAHNSTIYAMCQTRDVIVTGGDQDIKCWQLGNIVNRDRQGAPQPAIVLNAPRVTAARGASGPAFETNGLAVDKTNDAVIYAACGDNNAYAYDLNTGAVVGTFKGHSAYLHCVASGVNRIATGAEDGFVRVWDTRTMQTVQTLDPTTAVQKRSSKRPASTKSHERGWIGCVTFDHSENWVIAGGEQRFLAVFHTASASVTTALPTVGTNLAVLSQSDTIISAGGEGNVYYWNPVTGRLRTRVPVQQPGVYALAQRSADGVIAVAGASTRLELIAPSLARCAVLETI